MNQLNTLQEPVSERENPDSNEDIQRNITDFPKLEKLHKDPYQYPQGVAFLDGQYVPMSQAKISVLDWGFLHSDATYDVMHAWEGRIFRHSLYLDRFFSGLKKLHMSIPYDEDDVMKIVKNCVALSGLRSSYIEIICTRGSSPTFSRDPRDSLNRFMAFAVPFSSVANPEQQERGLHVAISSRVRISPDSVDPSIKNYHWLDLVGGLYDAYQEGGETAILLDSNGNISEGPGFNVFVVKDGSLATPDFSILPGITRRTVFDLCTELELTCESRSVSPNELYEADEIFVTSTAGGVMPVSKVSGKNVADGLVGPICQRIRNAYWEKHEDPDWSCAVLYPADKKE
ncbi:MAG: aminotransferase class IV [Motiliproteus sp.]